MNLMLIKIIGRLNKMKLNIKCPKCGRTNMEITSTDDKTPMYKCKHCGYLHNVFPKNWEQDKADEK